jgi:hypothetical protein
MSNKVELGKLVKVPIRDVWPSEPADFTPWLAKHINLLSEALGLGIDQDSLQEVSTEVAIGSFSADIVAQDADGSKIVIENQYGDTDHAHLGKMLTYAAGVDAKVIIWVTEQARDEHKRAIEFLNSNTTDDLNFFLVQVEAWKIGDSKPAPRFNAIESPNEWARAIKIAGKGKTDELKMIKFNFWQKVKDYGQEVADNLPWRDHSYDHWYNLSVGSSIAYITMYVNADRTHKVAVTYEFWPKSKDKTAYDELFSHKEEIETELGMKLEWARKDKNQFSWARITKDGDYRDELQQDEIAKWFVDMATRFYKVIPKYDGTVKK